MAKFIKKCLVCLLGTYALIGCSLDANLSSLSFQDTAPITVQVLTADSSLNSLSSFSVDLIFSSDVVDLTESYIQVTGGTLVPGSLVGSGKNYSISITPSGEGIVQISFPEQNISIAGSSDSKKTNSSSVSVSIDATSPTVQLTTAVVSPTPLTSIPVTVTFSESVTGLEINDFSISGGGATITSLTGSGSVYQINILPVMSATIYIELPIAAALDAAGNPSFASNELEIVYNTAPTDALGVSIAGPTPSLGSFATEFVWTVNYTGAWTVDLNAVTLLGTDNAGCSAVISGSGTSQRTITMSGCTGNGTVGFSIASGSAHDLDGNPAEAKVSGYATVSNEPPSLTIGNPSPTSGNSSTTFAWAVSYTGASNVTLSASDVNIHGVSVGCLVSIIGSGVSSREVHLTGCAGYGNISISLDAGTASSEAGLLAPAISSSKEVRLNKALSASFSLLNSVLSKDVSNTNRSFTVQLNAAAAVDVSVDYELTSYTTAVNPTDYNLENGTIIIPAGQTLGSINYTYNDSTVVGSRVIQPALTKVYVGDFVGSIGINQIQRTLIQDASDLSKKFTQVSTGGDHFCGINGLGDLLCAGSNAKGQLGISGATFLEKPTIVDAGVKYIFVSSGSGMTCAITDTYVLKCWGDGTSGKLGDGTNITKYTPVVVDSGTQYIWVSSAVSYHSCGITIDNILKCWGGNSFGQLGDNTTVQKYSPVEVDNASSYSKVSVGSEHSCGLLTDGTLKCWGRNYRAQLGDGMNLSQSNVPYEIDAGVKYSEVRAGANHNCAITMAGVLKCWGENQDKQMGNNGFGAMIYSPSVVDSGVTYSKVSSGSQHSCAVTSAGVLKCWGGNSYAQIGNGTSGSTVYLPEIVDSGVQYSQLSSRGSYNCGLTTGGVTKCWGNGFGNGIVSSLVDIPKFIDSNNTYAKISLNGKTTCGLLSSNQLKCWGVNTSGETGDGSSVTKNYPFEVQGRYVAIANGFRHGCGITETGVLKCWGTGTDGRIGHGMTSNSLPVIIDFGVSYASVSAGYAHTCGVTSAGVLKCWGSNSYGQLGDNTTANKLSPVVVDAGTSYKVVQVGGDSTCAITSSGVLKCWGYNSYGQVGDGTTVNKLSPVIIDSGVSYKEISIYESHACGITAANDLKCWGGNYSSQIGDGTWTNRTTPIPIDSGVKYNSISVGSTHSCGVTDTKVLKCWGANSSHQLGDGSQSSRSTPSVTDGSESYILVNARSYATCAITENNKLKCWGNNADGQLGLGAILGYPSSIDF